MANKVKIKDEQGNQVFPITHVSAVLNDNGDNIGEIVSSKQNELVSGSNIKTINGQSLLGSGNITIQGGSGGEGDVNVIESITFNGNAVLVDGNKNAAISYTAPVTSVNGNTGAVTVSVPTKVSDLTNDSGFISSYTETDPVFTESAAYGITSSDITNWNGKQEALVSGTNIKTINNESVLGSGNISISGGGGAVSSVNGQTGDVVLDLISLESTDSTAYSPDFNSESDTVHVTQQTLSSSQKAQARSNIGAADASTAVNSIAIRNIVTISQADYDALSSKDNTTLYIIS